MSHCIGTISQSRSVGGWRHRMVVRLRRLFRPEDISRMHPGRPKSTAPAPAPAMLMTSRDISPLVARTAARFADWQTRHAGRRRLIALDDRLLKDIGINRCDAEQEYRKPFWRL